MICVFVKELHLFTFVVFIFYLCENDIRRMDSCICIGIATLYLNACLHYICENGIRHLDSCIPIGIVILYLNMYLLCQYGIRHLDSCIRVSSHRDASAGAAHEARC